MTAPAAKPAAGTGSRSLRQAHPRYAEQLVKALLMIAALVSVATTIGIVIALIPPTVDFFQRVGVWEFLSGTVWTALFAEPEYGVLPLLAATLLITGIAVAVAIPVGLGAAIYLSEYAHPRTRKLLKPTLEVLAGIPTVVYGFFALAFVTPRLQDWWPFGGDGPEIKNALSAGLVMGVMIVPTIASLAEDAMAAVPRSLRDGAYALGSGRRTVAVRVVVPAALSGIVAAFVLGISRAIGETMIVLIAAGARPDLSWNPLHEMQTMTAFIAGAASGDVSTASFEYKTIFAVGAYLFVLTFVMNVISIRLVRKYREVYE
ncbi:phosphate ABC transporter permease subunit PstC [Streptomyces luteolifulvus]|jgi:phosphate transport system permease protein|uniref:Phosphate transport system permease protein n=1 Tax=Streptomyces luteolifulvus TaxID=2615112 RepID=A0A6H9V1B9_9ACTN|nr:phosphate ABC transporter permease subunit PstC [Streptomyces luteolifulvus]KAB1146695.1 phosphate ABC transporter permease subunit PstC [Streptomyces luteolifulvus]